MMVQQGEGGGAVKSRRNGARLFKNPPQPHMCIQDYIQGSWDPCYINVLSWGKIAMPHRPSEPVPLWGGMKVSPPRTEKPQCAVFAVMANPEILRLNGKNAQDPQERSALIDLLLDFVEAMNEGVVFTRCYTVLKDRDITGELKEVWMAVQVKRDREQESQQETWIDVQPPAPQYPQFEMSPEYSYQSSNNDQVYQSGHIVAQQYQPQMNQDQYSYPERGRGQQNCPAYPTPQYQFQQLPRQLVPQYINSNIHPNVGSNYGNQGVVNSNVNPNIPGHYQQYIALQQQMVGQRQLENVMHAVRETHTDLQQPSVMHVPHMQYDQPPPFSLPNSLQMNVLRLGRPHMGVTQKSNANKRQTGSPTHSKPANHGDKSPSKGSRMRILRDHRDEEGGQNVQVTDLDEELEEATNGQKVPKRKKELRQQILNSSDEITVLETDLPLEGTEDNAPNQDLTSKPLKTQILVLKRNSKPNNNETKGSNSNKTVKNAIRLTKLDGQQIYDLETERIAKQDKGSDESAPEDKKPSDNGGRNGFAQHKQAKERPKRFQTVNNIINNVFKIHPSTSSEEKAKSNGKNENEDVYHGYAILMKDSAQDEVTSEIAQISNQRLRRQCRSGRR